jgi:hypothetical protein
VTATTLPQHAVAAEAIARGDLLFALYSGDTPPRREDRLWLVPDGDEPGEVASGWLREAAVISARATGVRCRCSVVSVYPLDTAALGRIAGMHMWSERRLTRRLESGERLHALVVRAWAAPQGPPPQAGGTACYPADDLLPALTDSAFALLVARLEEALAGTTA